MRQCLAYGPALAAPRPARVGAGKGENQRAWEGRLVFNNASTIMKGALAGFGLAYLPEEQAHAHLAAGRLVRVLADWSEPFPGHHLYQPSRRQPTPAFAVLIDTRRYRG